MRKKPLILAALAVLAAGCSLSTPTPTAAVPGETLPAATLPAEPTSPTESTTPTTNPCPVPLEAAYGPSGFAAGVNPLTGLCPADPTRLDRRPLLVKVSNLPRNVRPQWGLSRADIVFEYYTEEGTTRFAALFYGNDVEMAGPIRSARFVDAHLVRGYQAVFAFGSAWEKVLDRLYSAEFADRLVIEGSDTPLFRFDPAGMNHLMVNTAELSAYATAKGVENGPQDLDGMTFQAAAPGSEFGGQPADEFTVRYSGAIYNRWQYDAASGRYLRFADTVDDPYLGQGEEYAQSSDRLTGEALAFDNVVVLYVLHERYADEVWDIQLLGSGTAYLFRDGQMYEATWQRNPDSVISLTSGGVPLPFKPGTTWFEVIGQGSELDTTQGLRFRHFMP